MKDLPIRPWRSQKAMLLSGFIVSCFFQLATAQQRGFSVFSEPRRPKWGQNVTLSLQGGPPRFVQCQWIRNSQMGGASGTILTYSPNTNRPTTPGKVFSGRERIGRNCSLHISGLSKSDVGNYSVTINTGSTQQQGDTQTQEEIYQSSFYLQMPESKQTAIRVEPRPKYPTPGQTVTLVPQGLPKEFHFCEWFRQTRFGTEERIQTYVPGERQNNQQRRETVQQDCSLAITQLTTADTGNYTIVAEAPSDQQHHPGKGNQHQDPEENSQSYLGHVYLQVNEPSKQDPQSGHKGGSVSLKYSAWIVAGASLGSLAWAESLMTLFSIFFGSLASLKPKLFP